MTESSGCLPWDRDTTQIDTCPYKYLTLQKTLLLIYIKLKLDRYYNTLI